MPDLTADPRPLKLGLKPARPGSVKLKFGNYVNAPELPPPPPTFGFEGVYPAKGWGMLGNDQYGCCVWAGAAHETMLWNKAVGRDVSFTADNVLSDYAAVTGFDPSDPSTDQGTDMDAAAKYRRKIGIIDAAGVRHPIDAYLDLEPGNLTQLWQALYLFETVGLGIEVPSSAMDQFNTGQPWDVVRGSKVEGGHYVPAVARRALGVDGAPVVITWAAQQQMTLRFFSKYNDQGVVYLSQDAVANGKYANLFDYDGLARDLAYVTRPTA